MRTLAPLAFWLVAACPKPEDTGDTDSDTPVDTDTDPVDTDTADTDSGPFVCTEDAAEPNDDIAHAVATTGGTDLAVCGGNPDVWAIDVPAYTIGSVGIVFDATIGDLDLTLWDADGGYLDGSSGDTDTESVALANTTADPQHLYVEIDGFLGAENTYDLTLQLVGPTDEACTNGADDDHDGAEDCWDADCALASACDCPTDDVFEPNDELATAQNGPSHETDLAVFYQDADYFTYIVPDGERLLVSAPWPDAIDQPMNVTLYDAEQNWIAFGDNGNPEIVWWDNDTGATQTITLEVTASDAACTTYGLDVTIGPPAPEVCDDLVDNDLDGDLDCADSACVSDGYCTCPLEDILEDDDTRETAVTGPTSGTYAVFPNDDDYYAYTVAGHATFSAHLTHNLGDVDLHLFDAGAALLTLSTSTDDTTEDVTWTNPSDAAAPVALQVSLYAGTCASYTLDVTNP